MTSEGMLKAMVETCMLADHRGGLRPGGSDDADTLRHLWQMKDRMEAGIADGTFSPAKVGRWLGYAQGVCVARGVMTLDEAKKINMAYAETDG